MSALKTISLALKLSSLISGSLDLSPPARGVGAGELFGAAGDLVAAAAGLDTAVAAGVTEGAGTTLAVGADVAVGAGGLDATEAAVGIGEGGDAAAGADAFGVGGLGVSLDVNRVCSGKGCVADDGGRGVFV